MQRRLLFPRQHLNNIFELDPEALKAKGIKGIITDMDNTLVPWDDRTVYPRLKEWLASLREQGFRLCIVSNSTPDRGSRLAEELGIPAIWHAVKPRRRSFRRALEILELSPQEVAVIGDQIFTDVLGGNRLGLYTILVTPISDKEFIWTRFMRKLERLVLERMEKHDLLE
ncbi:MAG TPA: YqeG family HAD IIIA-type phosphatase [Bacillota bacterium]|mgnify:CR=1 FL=1|nr:YqeG family HAD IIIA-type phosphatase [Bacillota bacterium]HOB86645.1 YqeG family HAD IIIA-type phosphatase [Bacillota bacterium]HOP68690.1 YqeG family HAD IIIA-type phosphatase [Bacillota bacterium]HPT33928.1 YqeG family HAD IIIA-type phosphatase [Bacillota bacterium]HPZ64706.1 YqeG family HAD IIIA-type phosphatase [Bacillota bacterium]